MIPTRGKKTFIVPHCIEIGKKGRKSKLHFISDEYKIKRHLKFKRTMASKRSNAIFEVALSSLRSASSARLFLCLLKIYERSIKQYCFKWKLNFIRFIFRLFFIRFFIFILFCFSLHGRLFAFVCLFVWCAGYYAPKVKPNTQKKRRIRNKSHIGLFFSIDICFISWR